MQNGELFLCSQLMRVSEGRSVSIGNLEDIYSNGCTIRMELPLPIGAQITIQCIGCPQGKRSCTACTFRGRIRGHEHDRVLGCLMQVEFESRIWSSEDWRPKHLTKIKTLARSADA
jgi:hypothetical protein